MNRKGLPRRRRKLNKVGNLTRKMVLEAPKDYL
jgi:hypothetical protein